MTKTTHKLRRKKSQKNTKSFLAKTTNKKIKKKKEIK